MSRWCFVGSSAESVSQYVYARHTYSIDVFITANWGILVCAAPHYYLRTEVFKSDMVDDYLFQARQAGTKIATLESRRDRFPNSDIAIPDPDHGEPCHGGYSSATMSGPMAIQFALNMGAKDIVLVGCNGYTEQRMYFSSHIHPGATPGRRNKSLQLVTQQIVDAWPDRHFLCIGKPVYEIQAKNWTVNKEWNGYGSVGTDA